MQYKRSYTRHPESLHAIFQHEKQDIHTFCQQTGTVCRYKMGFVIIHTPSESWALHQSHLDDTIILYHRNTVKLPGAPKTMYEIYRNYHIQDFPFKSIGYTLGYVYLHHLCTTRQTIPFDQLPQVMQDFLSYTKQHMNVPNRYTRRNARHAFYKQQKQLENQKKAAAIADLIESLFPEAD